MKEIENEMRFNRIINIRRNRAVILNNSKIHKEFDSYGETNDHNIFNSISTFSRPSTIQENYHFNNNTGVGKTN